MTALPLMASWRIRADSLPERMTCEPDVPGFTLPGAQALLAFTELLDSPSAAAEDAAAEAAQDAPFPLPAMIPEDVAGPVSLTQRIDFGALQGDRAVLVFSRIVGCGEILLDDRVAAVFDSSRRDAPGAFPGALRVDLSDALRLGRAQTLTLRFHEARPAGVPGAVFLRVTRRAQFTGVAVLPEPAQRTMTVRAQVATQRSGAYVLCVQAAPAQPGGEPLPARELPLVLRAGASVPATLTLRVAGDRFTPGTPCTPPALKFSLLYAPDGGGSRVLCDSMTLACGYPGAPAPVWLPLTAAECAQDARPLAGRLQAMHVCAVSLDAPAPEDFYLEMTRAGIGVRQTLPARHPLRAQLARHACVSLAEPPAAAEPESPACSAWMLCGVVGALRTPDPGLTPAELLFEAFGRPVHPAEPAAAAVLAWLRTVLLRLRAEAARQSRYTGALCAPGEWDDPDTADALRTALRPLHLSALPLLGAWWTGTRFSASLVAFVQEDTEGPLLATAVLEDDQGAELARLCAPCPARGGFIGVIEAVLPAQPCVLELTTRLTRGDTVVEESAMPVYVGERGPLEAAL